MPATLPSRHCNYWRPDLNILYTHYRVVQYTVFKFANNFSFKHHNKKCKNN
jgi:hypothetical protein